MEKINEKEGVWRTIRGRRVFIAKGEDLATAMKKSGKFDKLKREDVQKAKKQLDVEKAREKWDKEYDPKNYSNAKYQDEKEREKLKQRQNKAHENYNKAYEAREEFMSLYDDERDDSELSWQDKVAKNTREANRKAKELEEKRDEPQYKYNRDKWDDEYYGTFREKEAKNARVKEEPDNAPYEPVDAYKGYKEKADKLDETKKTWTGAEYTNDEFMEHLTDANWHHEREMIEKAGLTNKQLKELKKDVKLSMWSVELDKEKTQKLIDKVKKEFPSDDDKIKTYKEKKQSNNKVNYNDLKKELDDELSKRMGKEGAEHIRKERENIIKERGWKTKSPYLNEKTGKPAPYHQPENTIRWGSKVGPDNEYYIDVDSMTKKQTKELGYEDLKNMSAKELAEYDKGHAYKDENLAGYVRTKTLYNETGLAKHYNEMKKYESALNNKQEEKVKDNVIPRDFKKGYGKFKVKSTASDNTDDRYEITKDEYGTYHAKNLRTGETFTTFSSHLRNGNVFEFEKDDTKAKVEAFKDKKQSNNKISTSTATNRILEGSGKVNQKKLKSFADDGVATDITRYSDKDIDNLEKKHGRLTHVKTSMGTYGMNGALLKSEKTGEYFVVTARNSTLFRLV